MRSSERSRYDFTVTLIPLVIILTIILAIVVSPESTSNMINSVRNFLGNDFGSYYLTVGLGFVIISLYIAFSKYGKIKLGNCDRPKFSTLDWAFMIFTSTMAADILFYSLHEWMYYWNVTPLDFNEMTQAQKITWSETYSLFHWGVTPWIFYILPAVAYAYMMHVKKRYVQKISEACRPVLGLRTKSWVYKTIDIVSVVALLLATSTTFSVATPLLSSALAEIFNVQNTVFLTIGVLVAITVIYTTAVVIGFKGISKVSSACIVMFLSLVALFLFNDNFRFIVENALNSFGNLVQNFLRLSTWTDPSRQSGNGVTGVPQDWTVFYWAYWIAWSIATPFFIAKISEGRTIKQMILGGLTSGVACTFLSFTVFGGFGIAEQVSGNIQVAEMIAAGEAPSRVILEVFHQLPFPKFSLIILVLAMVGFYASTFDALTHVIASYSYKWINPDEEPSRGSKIYWSLLFASLPCALLFSESTSYQLQGLSIIAAFPISLLMILVVISFFKSAREDLKNEEQCPFK